MSESNNFKPDFSDLSHNSDGDDNITQNDKSNAKEKKSPTLPPSTELSKRFISQKIEEMLQEDISKQPTTINFSDQKPNISNVEEDIKQNTLSEYQDEEELISPTLPTLDKTNSTSISFSKKPEDKGNNVQNIIGFFRKYYLITFLSFFIVVGWTFFFINYYSSTTPMNKDVSIQIENFINWKNSAPIIATPIIVDVNGDKAPDVAFADNLGYLRAIDPRTKELIYETYLGSPVVASLTAMEVNNTPPKEIFAATERGNFFIINQQGGYFYRAREEFFKEALYTKPLVLENQQTFFLAGMEGKIWAVNNRYGEVIWVNKNSPFALAKEGIFSSLIFVKHQTTSQDISLIQQNFSGNLTTLAEQYGLLVLGENGTIANLDLATGGLRWTKKLTEGFKASPITLTVGNREVIVVVGIKGEVLVLDSITPNAKGKVLSSATLGDIVVSSPVVGFFDKNENSVQQVLFATEQGKLILGYLKDNGNEVSLRLEEIYRGEGFLATPIVADFNQNKIDDILIVSRNGTVSILELQKSKVREANEDTDINGSKEDIALNKVIELTPNHELLYNVTASPVVGDLNRDGQLEVVVAGENGAISILTLRTIPEALFAPNTMIATQFLKNEINSR